MTFAKILTSVQLVHMNAQLMKLVSTMLDLMNTHIAQDIGAKPAKTFQNVLNNLHVILMLAALSFPAATTVLVMVNTLEMAIHVQISTNALLKAHLLVISTLYAQTMGEWRRIIML